MTFNYRLPDSVTAPCALVHAAIAALAEGLRHFEVFHAHGNKWNADLCQDCKNLAYYSEDASFDLQGWTQLSPN